MTAVLRSGPTTATSARWTTAAESAVGILGAGHHLPGRTVDNAELGGLLGVDPAWIENRTGVVRRRWAAPGESTCDLATAAARHAMAGTGIRADEIGVVVVATPGAVGGQPAALVRDRITATGAAMIDLTAPGFVTALAIAQRIVLATGGYGLVVGAHVQDVDPFDRVACARLGDGAGAVVLGATWPGRGLQAVELTAGGSARGFLGTVRVDPVRVAHVVTDGSATDLPARAGRTVRRDLGDTGPAAIPLALSLGPAIAPGERVLLADTTSQALVTW